MTGFALGWRCGFGGCLGIGLRLGIGGVCCGGYRLRSDGLGGGFEGAFFKGDEGGEDLGELFAAGDFGFGFEVVDGAAAGLDEFVE